MLAAFWPAAAAHGCNSASSWAWLGKQSHPAGPTWVLGPHTGRASLHSLQMQQQASTWGCCGAQAANAYNHEPYFIGQQVYGTDALKNLLISFGYYPDFTRVRALTANT